MNKEQQAKLLSEIMQADEKDGLYDSVISKKETTQTAVDWLALQLYERMNMSGDGSVFDEILEQARAMEMEQINKACYDGYYREDLYDIRNYYNDTYKK